MDKGLEKILSQVDQMDAGSQESFKKALKFTLIREGLYFQDDGAETYRGINRRYYPDWQGWRYLDEGKPEEADKFVALFYYFHFWLPLKCDQLPMPVALALFDYAVNTGDRRAVMDLQESLNELDVFVKVDGVMGPKTVGAVLSLDMDRQRKLYLKLLLRRAYFYLELAKFEKYERYIKGWLTRVFDLLAEVEGLEIEI